MKENIAVSAPIDKPGIALRARDSSPHTVGADISLVISTGPAWTYSLRGVIGACKTDANQSITFLSPKFSWAVYKRLQVPHCWSPLHGLPLVLQACCLSLIIWDESNLSDSVPHVRCQRPQPWL